jgi:hypothetical protein
MAEFDYTAAAELFALRRRLPRREPSGYKRFEQAAQAIRFAIEELPRECLAGAFLEVDEQRYSCEDIGGCTKAQNIRSPVAVRDYDR